VTLQVLVNFRERTFMFLCLIEASYVLVYMVIAGFRQKLWLFGEYS
jgi:hypothetical protein